MELAQIGSYGSERDVIFERRKSPAESFLIPRGASELVWSVSPDARAPGGWEERQRCRGADLHVGNY